MTERSYNIRSIIIRLILGLATSCLVLALIFGTVSGDAHEAGPARLFHLLSRVSWEPIIVYAALQWVQALLRAVRYALMLRVSSYGRSPGFLPLLFVTMSRNMFVDLLPARAGELTYAALLNTACGVDGSACFSSMGLAVYFDILALLVTLGIALAWMSQRVVFMVSAVVVAVILFVAGIILISIARHIQFGLQRVRERFDFKDGWTRVFLFVDRVLTDIQKVKQQAVLGRVVVLSFVIRFVKYVALAVLFRGVAKESLLDSAGLSLPKALVALIASETTAALPLPAFMSFGSYEMGGLTALSLFGFDPAQAALVMLGTHVISQTVDYLWGGLSLMMLVLTSKFTVPKQKQELHETFDVKRGLRMAAILVLLASTVVLLAWQWRAFKKLGAVRPPSTVGTELSPTRDENTRLKSTARSLRGFIVWSSNRGGNHDIWRMDFPSLRIRPITHHPHPETFPRISPDGRRLVFARGQLEWVSHRDPRSWDVFLLDMETAEERCIATNAFYPLWTAEGRILFSRDDRIVTLMNPDTGESRVLLAEGQGNVPQSVTLGTPDYEPEAGRVIVTLRGRVRDVRVYSPSGESFRIGSGRGCQAFWSPDHTFIYYVDHGGRGGNTIYRCNPQGRDPTPWLDLPEPYSHEYFPKLSWDGKWMVLAAAAQGHEHDVADYEVFLWRVGSAEDSATRITFHTGNDNWPDVYIEKFR